MDHGVTVLVAVFAEWELTVIVEVSAIMASMLVSHSFRRFRIIGLTNGGIFGVSRLQDFWLFPTERLAVISVTFVQF